MAYISWVETIEVRIFNSDRCDLESRLVSFMAQVGTPETASTIAVYQRAMIDSDYCVQITHESKEAKPLGSPLGLRLRNALQEFGLVHHSVWIEF